MQILINILAVIGAITIIFLILLWISIRRDERKWRKDGKRLNVEIPLHNGACDARWTCKNVDKKICKVIPKDGEDFVECSHYENIK